MKILHRINLDVAAGVENQFRAFVTHPDVQDAFRHDLIYANRIHPALAVDILPQLAWAGTFKRWRRLPVPRWPARLRERRLAALIAQRQPDALLAWSGLAREAVSRAAKRTGVPLIYREGGGSWYAHSEPAAHRYVAQVRGAICNTRASMRMLQLKWGYAGPARVCLGGIRPDMLAAADTRAPRALTAPVQLGTAARLAAEKGVCLAIHALRRLRDQGLDCRLSIAGDGPDRAALQRMADDLGVSPHVEFLGSVQDMARFYEFIDVLLHPALQEPLGNVTIEAAAFGVPVVATRVDGMGETIRHGETGMTVPASRDFSEYARYGGGRSGMLSKQVYDPDSDALRPVRFAHPDELASAVAGIIADSAVHARMAGAAAPHARAYFTFDRHVADLLDALNMFMHNPAPTDSAPGLSRTYPQGHR